MIDPNDQKILIITQLCHKCKGCGTFYKIGDENAYDCDRCDGTGKIVNDIKVLSYEEHRPVSSEW